MKCLFLVWSSYPSVNMFGDPSVWYRVYQISDALVKLGMTCHVYHYTDIDDDFELEQDYDKIIFFRPQYSDQFLKLYNSCQEITQDLYASYDDLFFDIHQLRQSEFRCLEAPQKQILSSRPENYAKAFYFFDKFILSTEPMYDFVKNNFPHYQAHCQFNAVCPQVLALARNLLPNIKQFRKTRRIGYFAGGKSHENDLARISPALTEFLQENDFEFFCPETLTVPYQISDLGDKLVKTRRLSFFEMFLAYLKCEINIAPLMINQFTEAKSCIKFLESATFGVKLIGAPITDVKRVANKNFYPAVDVDEWRTQLKNAEQNQLGEAEIMRSLNYVSENFNTQIEAKRLIKFLDN